jgi:hypothetical protein
MIALGYSHLICTSIFTTEHYSIWVVIWENVAPKVFCSDT